MSVLIDTGIFSGAHNLRDKYHEQAVKLLGEALAGKYGTVYTTDYVFDEAVTLTLYRTGRARLAMELGEAILRSPRVSIIDVTEDLFKEAWETFKRHSEIPLSFTDATTIEAMRAREIGLIMSFDEDFDRVPGLARVCK